MCWCRVLSATPNICAWWGRNKVRLSLCPLPAVSSLTLSDSAANIPGVMFLATVGAFCLQFGVSCFEFGEAHFCHMCLTTNAAPWLFSITPGLVVPVSLALKAAERVRNVSADSISAPGTKIYMVKRVALDQQKHLSGFCLVEPTEALC